MDKSKVIVMLDGGHGSNTPGKRSVDGRLMEWKYVREIVDGIASELSKDGISSYIVHPEDEEFKSQAYDLRLRTDRANAKYDAERRNGKKAFYVSVHVNAAGSGKQWTGASGWTVWVAKNSSTNSKKLAQFMYDVADEKGLRGNRAVPACKYWSADYWVLRKTNMPAVLTENMFMDNKQDVDFLLSDEGKKAIIDIHVQGIKKYIEQM